MELQGQSKLLRIFVGEIDRIGHQLLYEAILLTAKEKGLAGGTVLKAINYDMLTVHHPWHGVSPGKNAPEVVNALIEIPQGSRSKYEVDKESGLLKLDRVIYSSFHYPINYGFIPQTLGQDEDPLDILVICSQPIQPLCLVQATVVG